MINELLKSIHIISEEKVKEAPYDNCIKAQIIQVYSLGKYRVRTSEQSEFNVHSLFFNFRYSIGDTVWILIINNIFTKNRYVLGAVEGKQATTILVSPNGTEFELSIDNDGNLTSQKIIKEE